MSENTSMVPLASRIAALVHAHFDALPARNKPKIFADGSREWIPMTGIVAVKGKHTPSESLHCISVTSGAKCLPASQIPRCQGLVLHDCHAEILAIRAFNYWLLTECHAILTEEKSHIFKPNKTGETKHDFIPRSPFIRRRQQAENRANEAKPPVAWPPLEIQPDINFYMYCTCAPCGDASMELCMANQEDATPWEVNRPTNPNLADQGDLLEETLLDGRAHFSLLGVVRRKPARMDAESTRSKSCSDKLALRQVSSLLSCETSLLVAPTENAYLTGLILPEDEVSRTACDRSFGEKGRMEALAGRSWPETPAYDGSTTTYRFRPFEVLSVPAEEVDALWQFAKPKAGEARSLLPSEQPSDATAPKVAPKKSKPGNQADAGLVPFKDWPSILQPKACLHKHEDSQDQAQDGHTFHPIPEANTYEEFKRAGDDVTGPLRIRAKAIHDAKEVLKGWVSNSGDEGWGLDVLIDPKKRKR
ncbi:uncharacterized protein N7482_008392 [Penicillium canariense]|uniref:A to I editase domain-containing protein n=1 Tax=Penicillium canariense TaxID=189055 RepID=A0A9W9HTU4_9EURO|nr:uncharacterized protein N7482_008392 [Penicillium canariense]KAJ5157292.1 hypothetical protein N7482_008392 [Penicillium canariense]